MTRRILFGVIAVLLLSSCTKQDAPVEPVWGKEPCAHCSMLIGDKRVAGQGVDNGERFFFDDIGCMALWAEDHGTARIWAHRAEGDGWVDAKRGQYASGARSPMGFDVEARAGAPLSWTDVRERVLQKTRKAP